VARPHGLDSVSIAAPAAYVRSLIGSGRRNRCFRRRWSHMQAAQVAARIKRLTSRLDMVIPDW